jgi:archaellum component FlaC
VVQVGATVSYHNPMDETSEPSWTNAIRTAVKEFVDAVNESSKQLASASERFAIESLQAADAAKTQSERSAASSAEMAQQAQRAAEDARNATASLQSAVDEAREQVRNEARLSVEQVASQTAQINQIGAQVTYDLQQRIDEMVARLEAGTTGHQEALETAQAATAAAQSAAERIETSVNAVEAAVANARRAAEEARSAAEQSEQSAGSVSVAVTSAQEAAESSRQSASLAEQAGKRSDFAAEASMLLERLETDYSLLTRLVQELHSRISNLSSVSMAPPAPTYEPQPEYTTETEPVYEEALEAPSDQASETPAYAEEMPEAVTSWEEPAIETPAVTSAWQELVAETPEATPSWPEPVIEMPEPQPMNDFIAEPGNPSPWPTEPPADLEMPEVPAVPEGLGEEISLQAPDEAAPVQEMPEPVADVMPEAAASSVPPITVFGRVQMTISPVPDFDRLLSLDSALARIQDVRSVTLADYAREEVIFRVEIEKPLSVVEFGRQLSETAGVSAEVTEASENTLSIRVS